ncbi:hypothetical protein JTB14_016251 [Gonioctena quinquepunctata]|nr:hypothetical protein JTB14_016251 [Gonioctena quinquepunctata]KAG5889146.1 hypothetical protein JTB14_016251 [Gonioctena quinquepunctata]
MSDLSTLNEAEFDDPTFDYVVKIPRGEKICFGSTAVRNTDPIGKGLSAHQKRLAPELHPKTGPGCYYTERRTSAFYEEFNKVRSNAGIGTFASKDNRFKYKVPFRSPSPGTYDPEAFWKSPKESCVPFGNSSKIRELKVSNTPGPLTYDIRKISKCRRLKFMNNFGRPTMTPCVEVICVAKSTHTCQKCEKLCQGDYWHLKYATFLCQSCWYLERANKMTYNHTELKEFKKIRNCSFMHSHEETNAALRILSQNKINKKIWLENYLDLYIKC